MPKLRALPTSSRTTRRQKCRQRVTPIRLHRVSLMQRCHNDLMWSSMHPNWVTGSESSALCERMAGSSATKSSLKIEPIHAPYSCDHRGNIPGQVARQIDWRVWTLLAGTQANVTLESRLAAGGEQDHGPERRNRKQLYSEALQRALLQSA